MLSVFFYGLTNVLYDPDEIKISTVTDNVSLKAQQT